MRTVMWRVPWPVCVLSVLWLVDLAGCGAAPEAGTPDVPPAEDVPANAVALQEEQRMLADVLANLDLTRPELHAVKAAGSDPVAAAAALRDYVRARSTFQHPVDRRQRLAVRGKCASAKELHTADDATRNILIASTVYPPHDFGAQIDWAHNPQTDNEWIWQLHRMSSWTPLGKAYWHTGDEKYAQAWARQFQDWVRHNLVEPKPAYAWRTIEAGIRGDSWIGQFQYFVDAEAFMPEVCVAFLAACLEHGRYLNAALAKNPHGNNWRLMEAEGLGAIALCFPEFKAAQPWRERAFAVLKDNLPRQVRADGMHYEQCFNYHEGCIHWFARTALLAKANGYATEFGPAYYATIESMAAALMQMSFPDGTMPQFGDGHSTQSIRQTLVEGADYYRREDFRFVGTAGKAGRAPDQMSVLLKESGFYALRSGWDANATCLVLKCGPDGGWHCQPDNGTFELFAGGRRLTPDSGCFVYHGDEAGRAWFRRTAVHQTLTLDGANSRYAPKLLMWKPGADLDVLVVENGSYEKLTHRRAVLFVKPNFFLVIDGAYGDAAGELRVHFQLAPGAAKFDAPNLRAQTALPDGTNLLVAAAVSSGTTLAEEAGQVSFLYGKKEPRPAFALVAQKDAAVVGMRFATVLAPFQGTAPAVRVERRTPRVRGNMNEEGGADWVEYDVTVGAETVRVGYDLATGDTWRRKP